MHICAHRSEGGSIRQGWLVDLSSFYFFFLFSFEPPLFKILTLPILVDTVERILYYSTYEILHQRGIQLKEEEERREKKKTFDYLRPAHYHIIHNIT